MNVRAAEVIGATGKKSETSAQLHIDERIAFWEHILPVLKPLSSLIADLTLKLVMPVLAGGDEDQRLADRIRNFCSHTNGCEALADVKSRLIQILNDRSFREEASTISFHTDADLNSLSQTPFDVV